MDQKEKTRRYSKVSIALKSYFFKLVYAKQMTIKEAARICRLNYSTAKAIIRDISQKEKDYIDQQVTDSKRLKQNNFPENFQRSDYREIKNSAIQILQAVSMGKQSVIMALWSQNPSKKSMLSPQQVLTL